MPTSGAARAALPAPADHEAAANPHASRPARAFGPRCPPWVLREPNCPRRWTMEQLHTAKRKSMEGREEERKRKNEIEVKRQNRSTHTPAHRDTRKHLLERNGRPSPYTRTGHPAANQRAAAGRPNPETRAQIAPVSLILSKKGRQPSPTLMPSPAPCHCSI